MNQTLLTLKKKAGRLITEVRLQGKEFYGRAEQKAQKLVFFAVSYVASRIRAKAPVPDPLSKIASACCWQASRIAPLVVFTLLIVGTQSGAQQVVQRGAFGRPALVMDETQEWTTPLLLSSDHDVELYIPDVSSPTWLAVNYESFIDKEQFTLSMFTFYKTTKACRTNQAAWGFSDGSHLDACVDIGYRIRRATIDKHEKTVTLIIAAMLDQQGEIIEDSTQTESLTKTWADLDQNTQSALEKATSLVSVQMKRYDRMIQNKQ